ncbi:hypothetical protein F4781DRAFT_424407 [Annulohypoxylon bovei var. microspora]|nr:hypothetical protein F4781DRAFT_424407 [Annulohypoxylon bovei var. microspora]
MLGISRVGHRDFIRNHRDFIRAGDDDETLLPSILCCRKWRPLALSILYGDVVLIQKRLAKFVENCTDHEIPKQTAESSLEASRQLPLWILRTRPTSLSILVNFPFPFTASQEIYSILDHLPTYCVSLEIDVRYGSSIPNFTADLQDHLHLFDSIRVTLPRLQHLRLRLPLTCPAMFSAKLPGQNAPCQAIHAPMLKACFINLSLRPPGPYSSQGVWATPCSDDTTRIPHVGLLAQLPPALPPVLPALKDFARLNSTNLERLWVIDAAWAEGSTWIQTTSGARLPITMLRKHQDMRKALTKVPFQNCNALNDMLGRNEGETGEKMLSEGPGELTQRWDLNETTPSGWKRGEHTASPMVRASRGSKSKPFVK